MKPTHSLLLLVSDTILSDIYERRLAGAGWKVHAARTLAEAERKAVRARPTVFLLDVKAVEDLVTTLKRLKSLPTMLRTQIVLLSDDQPVKHDVHEVVYTRHISPHDLLKKLSMLV